MYGKQSLVIDGCIDNDSFREYFMCVLFHFRNDLLRE